MQTLYGKYPKKITCQCNADEMDAEAVTIRLNDRCPKCHSFRRICIPKHQERIKAGFGVTDAQKAMEPVLAMQKELEPLIIRDEVMNDYFGNPFSYFSYFSYFMRLSGLYWSYAWAFLGLSPQKLQKKP